MAMTEAGKESLQIGQYFAALKYRLPGQPISLKADNRGAILFSANPEFYWQTQHIEVQYHLIREKVDSKEIVITYISIKDMVTNRLIEALASNPLKTFRPIIGM